VRCCPDREQMHRRRGVFMKRALLVTVLFVLALASVSASGIYEWRERQAAAARPAPTVTRPTVTQPTQPTVTQPTQPAVTQPTQPAVTRPQVVRQPDIIDLAMADGRFTTVLAAANRAGLTEVLRGDGPFTIFAPTDSAFAVYPQATINAVLAD
jgi:uncharacterized surface protein with fasciclin (FAS1) repeats